MASTDQKRSPAPSRPAVPESFEEQQPPSATDSVTASDLSPRARGLLNSLLSAGVVDLQKVCDEICSVPPLRNLVMKLGGSLTLDSGPSPGTVEEAIVLLGSERLRVLVNGWPFQTWRSESAGKHESSSSERAQGASHRSGMAKHAAPRRGGLRDLHGCKTLTNTAVNYGPISPVLLGFQDGAVPSPAEFPAQQLEDLAEMFVRDFAALALRIEPVAPEPRKNVLVAAAPGYSSSRRQRG